MRAALRKASLLTSGERVLMCRGAGVIAEADNLFLAMRIAGRMRLEKASESPPAASWSGLRLLFGALVHLFPE